MSWAGEWLRTKWLSTPASSPSGMCVYFVWCVGHMRVRARGQAENGEAAIAKGRNSGIVAMKVLE